MFPCAEYGARQKLCSAHCAGENRRIQFEAGLAPRSLPLLCGCSLVWNTERGKSFVRRIAPEKPQNQIRGGPCTSGTAPLCRHFFVWNRKRGNSNARPGANGSGAGVSILSGAKQPPVLARAAVARRALRKGVAEKEPVRADLDDGKPLARCGGQNADLRVSSGWNSASQASVMHMSGCQQKVCCTSQPQMTASKAAPSRIAQSMYVRRVMIFLLPCPCCVSVFSLLSQHSTCKVQ